MRRRNRSFGRGARGARAILRQPTEEHRDGVRRRPAPVAGLSKHDGRASRAPHRAPGASRRRRRDCGGRSRLSHPAGQGDDHFRRPAAPQREGKAARAFVADRRLLSLARPGLRSSRRRDRPLRRGERRVTRRQGDPRGGRAGHRPGRAKCSIRRHAEDRARRRRRRMGARSRRNAPRLARARQELPAGPASPWRDDAGAFREQGLRRHLRDVGERVRARFHPLQAEHRHASHRAAAGSRARRGHRALRGDPAPRARGARHSLPRFADWCDALLPQRRSVRAPRDAGASRATRTRSAGRPLSRVDRRLRYGRRGLFARHHVARGHDALR